MTPAETGPTPPPTVKLNTVPVAMELEALQTLIRPSPSLVKVAWVTVPAPRLPAPLVPLFPTKNTAVPGVLPLSRLEGLIVVAVTAASLGTTSVAVTMVPSGRGSR